MNTQDVIGELLNSNYFAGDAFVCLQQAVMLGDASKATQAGMRCMDLARRLEKVGTSAQPPTLAPTVSTPGWLDKCDEVLDDTADEFYSWGGAKWMVHHSTVFTWNPLIDEWQESTLLPHQIRQDGKRLEV